MITLRKVLGVTAVLAVLTNVLLVASNHLSGPHALALTAAVEIFLGTAYSVVSWRVSRAQRVPITQLIPPLALLEAEAQAWADLFRFFRRTQVIPPSATALTATAGAWVLPTMLSAAILIEVLAVELTVPWLWLRGLLMAVSLYSLGLMWGVTAAMFVYPHFVDRVNRDLVLRRGRTVVLRVPLSDIQSAHLKRGFGSSGHLVASGVLQLGGPEGTNVNIALRRALPAQRERWPWQKPVHEMVSRVEMHNDHPAVALHALTPPGTVDPYFLDGCGFRASISGGN